MAFARQAEEICRSDSEGMDIAETEQQVVSSVAAAGRTLLEGLVEARDDGAGTILCDGKRWYRVAPSQGTVICLLGKLDYVRPLYRCRSERRSLCPVDDSLGLLPGSMTRPAGKLAAYMVSQCPPRQAGQIFDRSGGMAPSVSSMQRLMGDLHWAWQGIEADALEEIRAGEEIPAEAASVSVSLDGAMVLLRPGEGPGGDGPDRNWREAACGTLSFHDAKGVRLSTISSGRMPQGGKIDLKRWLAQECSHVLRRRPDLTVLAIADGAADNWTFLSGLMPDAEAVDFFHAVGHLATASEHAASPGAWFRRWRQVLRDEPDGVIRVIRAIRGLRERAGNETARQELTRILNYFCEHRHRMRYHELRAQGLVIGSGIVEAANRTQIAERLKRSGMRWGITGGQAVLTFRTLVTSGRFDSAWDRIMRARGRNGAANDNRDQIDQPLAA